MLSFLWGAYLREDCECTLSCQKVLPRFDRLEVHKHVQVAEVICCAHPQRHDRVACHLHQEAEQTEFKCTHKATIAACRKYTR